MVLSSQLSVHGCNTTNQKAWPMRQLPRAAWLKVLAWSVSLIVTDAQALAARNRCLKATMPCRSLVLTKDDSREEGGSVDASQSTQDDTVRRGYVRAGRIAGGRDGECPS